MKLEGNWYSLESIVAAMAVPANRGVWKQRVFKSMASQCIELRLPLRRTVITEEGEKMAAGRPTRPLLISEQGARQLMAEAGAPWAGDITPYDVPTRLNWRARRFLVEEGGITAFLDAVALARAHPEVVLDPTDQAAPVPAMRFKQLVTDAGLEQYLEPDVLYLD